MRLEVICDPEGISRFAAEWSTFAHSHEGVTPFQLPDWLLTWWRHFGSGSPRVLAFRDSELVGVLPCFLLEWNGARQLTLIGSGVSDYLDPLFAPTHVDAIRACLREYLNATGEWDVCNFQDLANNTPLAALSSPSWNLEMRGEAQCSEAALDGTFEEFWKQRPRHLRRNVRRYGDRARQNGSLEFHATDEAHPLLLEALVQLHAARWNAHGEPGMIEANHSSRFLADIAQRFAAQNMLRIFTLHYHGQIAAIHLVFCYRKMIYGYLTGFDPAYGHLALGSVLLTEAIRDSYRHGFRCWNFCRGDEPYKSDFGAQPIRRCRLVLSRNRS